ncbi:MAG: hypothetical protein IM606_01715 [Cytophagales bacterium]|nr:hypothetical protein [Cytophagales bacterium]
MAIERSIHRDSYHCTMSKKEIIAHWLTMAERDWKSVLALHEAGQHMHALFFLTWLLRKY